MTAAAKKKKLGKKVVAYKRPGKPSIFVRDEYGHEIVLRTTQGGDFSSRSYVHACTYYGRIAFQGGVRTRLPNQQVLKSRFDSAYYHTGANVTQIDSPNKAKRRQVQEMSAVMQQMFGKPLSATEYALEIKGMPLSINRDPQKKTKHGYPQTSLRFEWCHLVGHNVGGADTPDNIVAGSQHVNSQQLLIENCLHKYFYEQGFSIRVQASVLGDPNSNSKKRYFGDVIKYEILGDGNETLFIYYLNCIQRTKPSLHQFTLIERNVITAMNLYLQKKYEVSQNDLTRVMDYLSDVFDLID